MCVTFSVVRYVGLRLGIFKLPASLQFKTQNSCFNKWRKPTVYLLYVADYFFRIFCEISPKPTHVLSVFSNHLPFTFVTVYTREHFEVVKASAPSLIYISFFLTLSVPSSTWYSVIGHLIFCHWLRSFKFIPRFSPQQNNYTAGSEETAQSTTLVVERKVIIC